MSRIIGGGGRGRRLRVPRGSVTRPSSARVRQTLFDVLAARIPECRFLDLFAGAGGIGLEALSRGAAEAVFVERDGAALAALRENLGRLGPAARRGRILGKEVKRGLAQLRRAGRRFDVVYLDPPWDEGDYEGVLEGLDGLLRPDARVVAEHFKKRALPERIGGLERARILRVGEHHLSFYRREDPP